MTENLLEGRKQLENSSANLKIEQNNNKTENLPELLPDVKQSKEDKICMETEAISQTATSDNQEHKITQFVLQLLGDLKGQEELHLSEVKELRKELEEKDNICNQLKLEISQVRENPTFYDLKSHEERHSREVKDLRTQLELNDNVNQKLTNEVFTVRKNFIQMRKQLLNDLKIREECHLRYVNELREELKAKENNLKDQEERHSREVNKLREDLDVRDNTCQELELKVSQVRENPEFIKMRQQLLDDLKGQKEHHSQEVKEFRKEMKINDNKCHQLTNEVFDVRKNFIQMREQLLNDQKSQEGRHLQEVKELRLELESKENNRKDAEEHHLREVTELRKELKINVTMCQQLTNEVFEMQKRLESQDERHLLEINAKHEELESKDSLCQLLELKVSQVRENPEFLQMRQQLLDELEGQEELHLVEINKLRKELEAKDTICHQLEHEVFAVQENAEFIQMREQLMDNLKDQEERHLREISDLRKVQEDKDKLCLEKEQEAAQLRDRLNFNMSCPICMEPWNSSEHRMVALLCGHIFGESCARQCLQRNSNCPECRAPASESNIRKLFPR
ncbi:RING finger protein PFF0165c-like [Drosophila nasuta]|uniref:RING finger protein PFF0165c-like n=1 Tax=Drosophila nasuta TaxID=42062 RepID=UPI00295F0E83|nr:RING finger protein PFF0165c-like [Drosophila nasuta]XP_060659334.1 RING finger protein PFF0165c-like [Drosophila nasuta]XP_060659335.1 RING finger protein PFF0165c-like [Drosophila nasuta]